MSLPELHGTGFLPHTFILSFSLLCAPTLLCLASPFSCSPYVGYLFERGKFGQLVLGEEIPLHDPSVLWFLELTHELELLKIHPRCVSCFQVGSLSLSH